MAEEKKIMDSIDPNSRDYDIKAISIDPRFKQINKEVLVTVALFFLHAVVLIVNYMTGAPDPANYTYIGPFPSWLAFQLGEFVVYIILVFVLISCFYRDMDIAPRGKIYPKKKK